eukprot:SAG11_NODE_5571_length_1521_cov_1.201828_1_plen_208_part_00
MCYHRTIEPLRSKILLSSRCSFPHLLVPWPSSTSTRQHVVAAALVVTKVLAAALSRCSLEQGRPVLHLLPVCPHRAGALRLECQEATLRCGLHVEWLHGGPEHRDCHPILWIWRPRLPNTVGLAAANHLIATDKFVNLSRRDHYDGREQRIRRLVGRRVDRGGGMCKLVREEEGMGTGSLRMLVTAPTGGYLKRATSSTRTESVRSW